MTKNPDYSLDLRRAVCLSISTGGGRFHAFSEYPLEDSSPDPGLVFVSENDFLHRAGNSLQLTSIPSNKRFDRTLPLSERLANNNFLDGSTHATDITLEGGFRALWSPEERGYSCYDFNHRHSRIAYVARIINPDIVIETFPRRNIVCILSGGAKKDYAHVSFNRDGSRLAGLGRGNVDKKLWIWRVDPAAMQNDGSSLTNTLSEKQKHCKGELIVAIDLERDCKWCEFNPCNSDQIASLSSDGACVIVSTMIHVLDDVQVRHIKLSAQGSPQSSDSGNTWTIGCNEAFETTPTSTVEPRCTSCSWEKGSKLILGTAFGTVHVFDVHDGKQLLRINNECPESPVIKLLISKNHVITAFENGTVLFFWRKREDGTEDSYALQHEVRVPSDILLLACNTEFTKLTAVCKNGCLHRLDIGGFTNAEQLEKGNFLGAANQTTETDVSIHSDMVLALTPVLLAGKAAYMTMISGGVDGTVRAWKDSLLTSNLNNGVPMKSCLSSLKLSNSPITALATLVGFPVFAAGTADGCLLLVHVGRRDGSIDAGIQMTIITHEKLSMAPVTSMAHNHETNKLAVGCNIAGTVFVVNTASESLGIIGMATTVDKQPVSFIMWDRSNQLIVGSDNGLLSCIDTAAMTGSSDAPPYEWTHQLSVETTLLACSQASKGDRCICYVGRRGLKGIECYQVPDKDNDATDVSVPLSQTLGGGTECRTIAVSAKNDFIAGGNFTGGISIYKNHRRGGMKLHGTVPIHKGPVVALSFSADGRRLYASGTDGSFFVCNVLGTSGYKPVLSTTEYDFLASKDSQYQSNRPRSNVAKTTWTDTAEARRKEHLEEKLEMRYKLRELSRRLVTIANENEKCNELEKLDRHELCLDTRGENDFIAKTKQDCEEIRVKIKAEDARKGMEAVRIRQEYWDKIISHPCCLKPFDPVTSTSVTNFPIRNMTTDETRKVNMARFLRRMEIKDLRRNTNKSSPCGLCWANFLICGDCEENTRMKKRIRRSSDPSQCAIIVVNSSSSSSSRSLRDNSADDPESDEDCFGKFVEVNPESTDHTLLYPPLAVRTEAQRRCQILLLKASLRSIVQKFNHRFDELRAEKELAISFIEAKNERIEEIFAELERADTCSKPCFSDCEVPESVLQVRDDEMTRYETSEKRETRKKTEEEQRKSALLMTNTDDAPRRALMDMMNGTLEVKKQVIEEPIIKRETWIEELSYEDMNADQKKLVDNYKKCSKELFEQNRTILDLELKRLQSEVNERMESFDKRLRDLLSERKAVQSVVITHELYVAHLANSILKREEASTIDSEMDRRIQNMQDQHRKLSATSTKLQAEQDRLRDELNKICEKDKMMEKTFRRDIQKASPDPLDQDTVNMLVHLYKKRGIHVNHVVGHQKMNTIGRKLSRTGTSTKTSRSRYSGREGSSWRHASGREGSSWRHVQKNSVGSSSRHSSSRDTKKSAGVFQTAVSEAQGVIDEGNIATSDPFYGVEDDAVVQCEIDMSTENIPQLHLHHIPEGFHVEKVVWGALQNLRNEKIRQEAAVVAATKRWTRIKKQYDVAKATEASHGSSIVQIEATRDKLQLREYRAFMDPDVLAYVKQGQDEIDKEAVVTDYADTILLPPHLVEDTNKEIRDLGEQQIRFLTRTQKFRRVINFMHWNRDYLELKEHDLNEQYVDWQLLRVTKQLKMVLSGVDNTEGDRAQRGRKEEMLAKRRTIYDAKLAKLRQKRARTKKQLDERDAENKRLNTQLERLKKDVHAWEDKNARTLDETKSEAGLVDDDKMRSISKNTKLKKHVRSQARGIEALRSELGRLRERTYPSFAVQQRDGLNPDERSAF